MRFNVSKQAWQACQLHYRPASRVEHSVLVISEMIKCKLCSSQLPECEYEYAFYDAINK